MTCPIHPDKTSYPNRLEANIALASIQQKAQKHRKTRARELPIRSYHCDGCGRHHLTSQPAKGQSESR